MLKKLTRYYYKKKEKNSRSWKSRLVDLSVCVRLRDINVSLTSFSRKNREEGDKKRGKRRKQEDCLATSVQQEVSTITLIIIIIYPTPYIKR